MSIESAMPSNHLILCHPLLLPPSIFPSIRVFSNESVLRIRWPKYWSFSFSISPSNGIQSTDSFKFGQMLNGLDIHSFLLPRLWDSHLYSSTETRISPHWWCNMMPVSMVGDISARFIHTQTHVSPGNFPGGPGAPNAGDDTSSIPRWGTKIPQAMPCRRKQTLIPFVTNGIL